MNEDMSDGPAEAAAPKALRDLRATARPLIIKLPNVPPGICGSCFTLGYRKRLFAVTAAHVTKGSQSQHVRVAADSDLRHSFQLGAGVVVSPPGDPDGVDVIAYPTGLSGFSEETLKAAQILNLEDPGVTAWESSAFVADFLVVGFPRQLNEIDFNRKVIKTSQVMLRGRYECVARVDGHRHRLRVENPQGLDEFAGFSGGPVFSVEHRVAAPPAFRFCGVALMGTASSKLVHFVDADAVKFVLDTAIEHITGTRSFLGPPPELFA